MIIPEYNQIVIEGRIYTSKLKKDFSEFFNYIKDKYKDCNLSEQIYRYYHNIDTIPKCPTCGKPLPYASLSVGYRRYCNIKCANSNPIKKENTKRTNQQKYNGTGFASAYLRDKQIDTMIQKYGVDSPLKNDTIREKLKHTNNIRYGADYGLQNKNVQKKISITNNTKYGGRGFSSKSIRAKMQNTCLEKYGDINYSNEKQRKQTCLERYGVEFPFQSETIRDKVWKHNLECFGTKHVLQNKDILTKSIKAKRENFISNHTDIISIDNIDGITVYTCKCPHSDCNKCKEKQFQISPTKYSQRKIDNNELCTKLSPGSIYKNTTLECFVQIILDKYNIKYECNNRKILDKKELDIYIPTHNLAIECNGCYWHSLKDRTYHYNKFISCKEKGIQLVTVWEDQIVNNPEKIESIILSKLGIYKERIYARKCSVHLVDSEHCREFLNCYHLQGSVNSSIRLGLYYNDELISVMTFGKGRKCLNSKDEWELYRYCCKSGVQVIGGASKLFKYFIDTYRPNSIVSFSSNDISDGSLYKKLGFKEQGSSIGYWYIDREFNRYHRYNFTKQKLIQEGFDPNKTESEIMKSRGFYCIYDTGQIKWRWTKELI